MNAETLLLILKLLELIASVAVRAPEIKAEFDALRAEVETMVREDRNPTPEEWSAMNARADDLHARLQGSGS